MVSRCSDIYFCITWKKRRGTRCLAVHCKNCGHRKPETRLHTTLLGGSKIKKRVAFLFSFMYFWIILKFLLDQPMLLKSFLLSLCVFPVFWGALVVLTASCCNLNEKLPSSLPNFYYFSVSLVVLKGFCWLPHWGVCILVVYWRAFV